MAGDLNSKHINWGCRVTNSNGSKLQSFIDNTSYTISALNVLTYFPTDINRLPDILEILIINSFIYMRTRTSHRTRLRSHSFKNNY